MNIIIKEIRDWITNFMNNYKIKNNKKRIKKNTTNILLLYGEDEIQKDNIIKTAFKTLPQYNIKYITQKELELLNNNKKDNKYLTFIYSYFNQLSIDEDDRMKIMIINENKIYNFHQYKKETIIELINANNNRYPIILILNSSHSKLLNTLKKKTKYIYINNLSSNDIITYIKMKFKNNNIIDKTNNKIINLIIELSNYNLNKVNTLLYDLLNTYCDNNIITEENLINFKNNTILNNNKETIINTNYKLLTSFNGLNESFELYNHDKIYNPLVMEEQYMNKIIQYENEYSNDNEKMKYLNKITLKISKCFVYSNLYDTYIFNYQKWNLSNIYGFFSCILPSYYLSLLKTKYKFNPYITFPIDMNKASIQRINTKQIDSIYENINLIDITYYIYLNELIYYLITKSSNNTTNINRIKITSITKELIKTYNLNMQLIEKILKINKLSNNELKLSKKMYNYLFPNEEL